MYQISILGERSAVQSDLAFYTQIVYSGMLGKTEEEIKKSFFEVFKKEEEKREYNIAKFDESVFSKYLIDVDVKPTLSGNEEVWSPEKGFPNSGYGPGLRGIPSKDSEETVVSSSGSDDGEECLEVKTSPDSDIEYKNTFSKVFLGELNKVSGSRNSPLLKENMEDTLDDENQVGSLDDDFISYDYEDDEAFPRGGSDVVSSEEYEEDASCKDTDDALDDEDDDYWADQDYQEENQEYEEEEDYSDDYWADQGYQEENQGYEKEEDYSDDEDLEEPWEENECVESAYEEIQEFSGVDEDEVSAGSKTVVVEVQKNESIGGIEDVPSDLRDFVKMNHGCDVSLALKYFSGKEIEKQLLSGRVFKRKNKLLV